MPTNGNANLYPQKVVLVESLIERLKDNFGQVTADGLFVRAHKISSALPFPCLIVELCKLSKVPIISGVDNEVKVTKR